MFPFNNITNDDLKFTLSNEKMNDSQYSLNLNFETFNFNDYNICDFEKDNDP